MKSILRYIWRRFGFKRAWQGIKFRKLLRQWNVTKASLPVRAPTASPTVLIIPSDPVLLNSSRGDDAMLTAVMTYSRARWPDVRFVVATGGDVADAQAQTIGAQACRVFGVGLSYQQILEKLIALGPTHSVTIGADVLDGSYDPLFTAQLLITTDLLARTGVVCAVTGFSFSKAPYPGLKDIYNNFAPSVTFNLRDPVSYARFQSFTTAPATLVTDVAFLLSPNKETALVLENAAWIANQKAMGRKVIGVNIHPLILEPTERHNIQRVVTNFADILIPLMKEKSVSLVFMEHDFRGESADILCLKPLQESLAAQEAPHLYWPSTHMSAAELKATCSLLDMVISSRMHLMIGAIGVGTPVFGINYKDKMEGLLQHCELDTSYLCTAKELLADKSACLKKMARFVDDEPQIRQTLQDKQPTIKAMSSKNLVNLK
jgi:polysaccharide pyruvyl transferase WcaK-like protein